MKKTEQKVLKFIEQFKLIHEGDKILVAFSGGPDSVFALNFLNKFRKKYKIELLALHFNHGLRGNESDEDANFAKEFCTRLNIEFISQKLNVKEFAKKNKFSIEEAARLMRYKNLESIAKKMNCTKIVTAHNLSDNTETILMNLFNGTGLSGLKGIPIQRKNIVRPLICLSKQEILEYLKKEKINYRVDSSNLLDDFRRNYIRNQIIPLIKIRLNPQIDEALFRSSQNLVNSLQLNETIVANLIARFVVRKLNAVDIKIKLKDIFNGSIPGEVLRALLKEHFEYALEFDDYQKINSLLPKQKGKQVQLSSNLIALRESDSIRIQRKQKTSYGKVEIGIGSKILFGSREVGVELADKEKVKFRTDMKTEFISADNLNEKFILRGWKSGDKFKPIGMTHFKKVSDFLTDIKIPSSLRKDQLVLLNRNQIVWVVGLRIDDRYKLNSKTKKVYKLWVK
ncbi:MAG: tRNA lysidine(34) synthetase TilS [Ignavibacteriales bacterium]|nr:tRNA lysidine(34) synthetase TilS [Ignavibacteriales bacterium]